MQGALCYSKDGRMKKRTKIFIMYAARYFVVFWLTFGVMTWYNRVNYYQEGNHAMEQWLITLIITAGVSLLASVFTALITAAIKNKRLDARIGLDKEGSTLVERIGVESGEPSLTRQHNEIKESVAYLKEIRDRDLREEKERNALLSSGVKLDEVVQQLNAWKEQEIKLRADYDNEKRQLILLISELRQENSLLRATNAHLEKQVGQLLYGEQNRKSKENNDFEM
jgi:hypothetical protein